jgi:phospholipid/cholesterol/gamma-HCH transport system ATP-binding protein
MPVAASTVLGRARSAVGRTTSGAASRVGMLFQQGALFSAFSVLENIAFALRELGKSLPDDLVRDAVDGQAADGGAGRIGPRPQDAGGSVGRHDQAGGAGARAHHGPAAAVAGRTHGRAGPRQRSDAFCALLQGSLHQELGLTVVMVTHDLDTMLRAVSTRVAVVADKHIVAQGSAAEVMAQPHPFIKEFFLGERGLRAAALLHNTPKAG